MHTVRNAGNKVDCGPVRYTNPVFNSSFPDPFILKFGDTFYGFSTGLTDAADRVFPLIRSRDLVRWELVGGAMDPLATAPIHYWAPEVTYFNGVFYLYYSCGNEIHMEIRVATSTRPDGGFRDSGVCLTREDFAIDPHVFIDSEGDRYLFYATDFLTHTHIGTGTVVDRLPDWFHLEGNPRPVTRARFDWQVYDPRRAEKGNVRWHTVEGPAVIKRKGKYFQMFSGGNWQNESYGVGYAVGKDLQGTGEWEQPIDGAVVRPILQSMGGQILGPGHNSVVLGPNNRELFCVYHSWKDGHRVMSIDRLDIVGARVVLLGPTTTPQMKPFRPTKPDFPFESTQGRATVKSSSPNFLLKSMVVLEAQDGKIDIRISSSGAIIGSLSLGSDEVLFSSGLNPPVSLAYPDGISPSFFQNVGIEVNEAALNLTLNDRTWHGATIEKVPGAVDLDIDYTGARIMNFDVTEGYVDLFETGSSDETDGWVGLGRPVVLRVAGGNLQVQPAPALNERPVVAVKGNCFQRFEFAANVCSSTLNPGSQPAYGFVLVSEADSILAQFDIMSTGIVEVTALGDRLPDVQLPAPPFAAVDLQQFRFVKTEDTMQIDWEGQQVAEIKVGSQRSRMGIVSHDSDVLIEMVRSIKIGQ